jgi:hypothetical protein
VRVGGASVRTAGGTSVVTGADGTATLPLPPGTHRLRAEARGMVRSFAKVVTVR